MRRVAVVSRAGEGGRGAEGGGGGGVGEEGWGRGGGACYRRCERLARTRRHECTQVDAWPMLVANAGNIWRATMSIPANMNLLGRWEHANDRLLHSGARRYTNSAALCVSLHASLLCQVSASRRISTVRWLQFVDSDFRATELQLCKKHWVFDSTCLKTMLSYFSRSPPGMSQK